MAMSVGSAEGEAEVMVEMNTTPLIDVMLVLLVMLIVTLPIQTHAVKLDMPRPDVKPPDDNIVHEVVQLEVDFDGTPIWNGTPVPNRIQLDGYFLNAASQPVQPEIHLKPNRLAKYGTVARVLADAQKLGVKRIGFVGNEQYIE